MSNYTISLLLHYYGIIEPVKVAQCERLLGPYNNREEKPKGLSFPVSFKLRTLMITFGGWTSLVPPICIAYVLRYDWSKCYCDCSCWNMNQWEWELLFGNKSEDYWIPSAVYIPWCEYTQELSRAIRSYSRIIRAYVACSWSSRSGLYVTERSTKFFFQLKFDHH